MGDLEQAFQKRTAKDIYAAVDAALKEGHSVNTQLRNGNYPLHEAAERGLDETIRLLLTRDADVTSLNREGYAPLHVAVRSGNLRSIDHLLNARANVNAEGGSSRSAPLHMVFAASRRASESMLPMVERLVAAGANVNARDVEENTPMHSAARFFSWALNYPAEYGDIPRQIVFFLGTHGASLAAQNDEDETPRMAGRNRMPFGSGVPKAYTDTFDELERRERIRPSARALAELAASGGIPDADANGGRGHALPPEMNAEILSYLNPPRTGPPSPADVERHRAQYQRLTNAQRERDIAMSKGGRRKKTARKTRRRATRRRR